MRNRIVLLGGNQVTREARRMLRLCVYRVLRDQNYGIGCRIELHLTDDAHIRETNLATRNIDKATDVLSYPQIDWAAGETHKPCEPDGRAYLGEMLISLDKAQSQAAEYGHSFARELGFLAAHGTLHLAGYDHQSEKEEALMRSKEEAVLASLGLER